MYLLLPIGLFVITLAILAYLISRKFVYLKKLSPEVIEKGGTQQGVARAMLPELYTVLGQKNVQNTKVSVLSTWSKMLSKFRMLSKSIDTWIHNHSLFVRKKETYHRDALSERETSPAKDVTPSDPKAQEQELILQIARDPKDPSLYKKLGALYVIMNEFTDAQEAYTKAQELDGDDTEVKRELDKIREKITI